MRMGMLIADSDPGKSSCMILAAAPNVISTNDGNLAIQFVSSPPNTNPVWEDLVQSGRHDFVAANTIIDTMNKIKAPLFHFILNPLKGNLSGNHMEPAVVVT